MSTKLQFSCLTNSGMAPCDKDKNCATGINYELYYSDLTTGIIKDITCNSEKRKETVVMPAKKLPNCLHHL